MSKVEFTPDQAKQEIDGIISMFGELNDDLARTGKELLKTNKAEPVMIAMAMTCLEYVKQLPEEAVKAAKVITGHWQDAGKAK